MHQNLKEGERKSSFFIGLGRKIMLIDIVNSSLEKLNIEPHQYIVDIKVVDSKVRKKITVFMDADTGISIDELGEYSRKLGKDLEEQIEGAFTLEVSSPGTDSPIVLPRQYIKNVGRTLKINTLEGTEVEGKLLEILDNGLKILPNSKKSEPIMIEFEKIKTSKVVISFK